MSTKEKTWGLWKIAGVMVAGLLGTTLMVVLFALGVGTVVGLAKIGFDWVVGM